MGGGGGEGVAGAGAACVTNDPNCWKISVENLTDEWISRSMLKIKTRMPYFTFTTWKNF